MYRGAETVLLRYADEKMFPRILNINAQKTLWKPTKRRYFVDDTPLQLPVVPGITERGLGGASLTYGYRYFR